MEKTPLYSIGHGSRKAQDFLALLQGFGIRYLIDVRSKPFSRFHPQFSRNRLQDFLEEHGIVYVFMGDTLGGRPEDPGCYNSEGRVDYAKVREKDFFRRGIERLKTAYAKNIPAAIMCSERDPRMCHRSRLIGTALVGQGISLQHIDIDGKLKSQEIIMSHLSKNNPGPDLFGA